MGWKRELQVTDKGIAGEGVDGLRPRGDAIAGFRVAGRQR
jgi:hypothetical protein